MLYKIVVGAQIRLFDCKQTLTLELLHSYMNKNFPKLAHFSFYYVDQDGDHIVLESNEDVTVYVQSEVKKPKIYVQEQMAENKELLCNSTVIDLQKEFKQKENVEQKVEEKEIQSSKCEQRLVEEVKVQSRNEEKVEEQKEQKSIISHDVTCHDCQVGPICGIRYKCGICNQIDLCEKCFLAAKHNQDHPFIKIRDPKSAPLDMRIEFKDKVSAEQKPKESINFVDNELKFTSKQEKVFLITSFLQNVFGPDNFSSYKQFAKQTTQKSEQKLIENYIAWMQRKNQQDKPFFLWLKQRATNALKGVGQLFR